MSEREQEPPPPSWRTVNPATGESLNADGAPLRPMTESPPPVEPCTECIGREVCPVCDGDDPDCAECQGSGDCAACRADVA